MNLILIYPEDFLNTDGLVQLTGRRLKHVLDVHRAGLGDTLCVGLAGGRIGVGTVTRIEASLLEMQVRFDREPPPALPVTVILALPRPKVLRRALRLLSCMGVKRIYFLNSFRVEKSYWQSPFLDQASMQEQLVLGLEQAKDTVLPEVTLRFLFKPFVEDELPGLVKGTRPLVAHPSAVAPVPRGAPDAVTLAIGPEGGFIPYEVEKLVACGFQPVSMGNRILNVEAAVPALLSRLF